MSPCLYFSFVVSPVSPVLPPLRCVVVLDCRCFQTPAAVPGRPVLGVRQHHGAAGPPAVQRGDGRRAAGPGQREWLQHRSPDTLTLPDTAEIGQYESLRITVLMLDLSEKWLR